MKPRGRLWRSGLKQQHDSHKRRLTRICGWPRLADAESRRVSPAKLPPEIVQKVNAEVVRILKLPDVISLLDSQGTTPVGDSPKELARWLADERARWAKVIKESGFKLEQ